MSDKILSEIVFFSVLLLGWVNIFCTRRTQYWSPQKWYSARGSATSPPPRRSAWSVKCRACEWSTTAQSDSRRWRLANYPRSFTFTAAQESVDWGIKSCAPLWGRRNGDTLSGWCAGRRTWYRHLTPTISCWSMRRERRSARESPCRFPWCCAPKRAISRRYCPSRHGLFELLN